MGVVPGTTLLPVLLTLDSPVSTLAPRSCKIPDSIFSREEVRSRIVSLWDRDWDGYVDLADVVAQALHESSHSQHFGQCLHLLGGDGVGAA